MRVGTDLGGRFTLSNRLLRMSLGEAARTWGSLGLDRVLGLIDDALDGWAVPQAAALTQVQGQTDESRCRMIVPTTAAHVLPDVPKWYWICNRLQTDVVVTCSASSAGVSVAPGHVTLVLCDGSSVSRPRAAPGFSRVVVPDAGRHQVPLTDWGTLYVLSRPVTVVLPPSPPSGFPLTVSNRSGDFADVTAAATIMAPDTRVALLATDQGPALEDDAGDGIGAILSGLDGTMQQLPDGGVVTFVWSQAMGLWVTLRD